MREPARALLALLLAGALAVGCSAGAASPSGDETPVRAMTMEPGETATVTVTTHCGYEWLELTVNGQLWRTDELGADGVGNVTETAWPHGQGVARLELDLVAADRLDVTAVGTGVTHTYTPTTATSGCE